MGALLATNVLAHREQFHRSRLVSVSGFHFSEIRRPAQRGRFYERYPHATRKGTAMRIEIDREKLGRIVLVLQGGGGLGAYQADVYWSELYSTIRRAAAP